MIINFLKRTITFVLGVSLVLFLIFFIPQYRHLAMDIFVFALCLMAEIETSKIVLKKISPIPLFSAVIPIISHFKSEYTELALVFFILLTLLTEIKTGEKDNFDSSTESVSKKIFCIVYPSYLISFITRFFSSENVNSYCIFLLLLLVFTNDTFAYVFGLLFGKNNKGIVKVSPNKSVAGFLGGFLMCIVFCIIYFKTFKKHLPSFGIEMQIILATISALLANIGDLAESALKRSAKIKDSGTIILGRGGVLDSLDSFITTGPLFYFVFRYLVR